MWTKMILYLKVMASYFSNQNVNRLRNSDFSEKLKFDNRAKKPKIRHIDADQKAIYRLPLGLSVQGKVKLH